MIYFDNSATTKISPDALATYNKVSTDFFGNPSSLHALGTKANEVLQSSRAQIAKLIGAKPDEIYFTSGGTEGDNWVIKGTAMAKREFGRHLITTSIEHPAVINTMKQLEKLGFEVTYLPVDRRGFIHIDDLKAAIRKDTILVSIMAVNNEIGSMQPRGCWIIIRIFIFMSMLYKPLVRGWMQRCRIRGLIFSVFPAISFMLPAVPALSMPKRVACLIRC